MGDLIDRQAAIELILSGKVDDDSPEWVGVECPEECNSFLEWAAEEVGKMPSAQQTLYGYKVEHLAYIARVMEKEGVTAEYAVRTFDDMSRAIKMIIEEAQQKVEETLNERFNQQTSGY